MLLVNADEATVRQVIDQVQPDLMQFHGDESPDFCQQFDFPFIRAIRMREGLDIDAEVAAYRADAGFLFDAWSEDQYGGTGHQFDWSRLPSSRDYPLILAGGLTPDNVASAVSLVASGYGGCQRRGGVFARGERPAKLRTLSAMPNRPSPSRL